MDGVDYTGVVLLFLGAVALCLTLVVVSFVLIRLGRRHSENAR